MAWYDWFTSQGRNYIYDQKRNEASAGVLRDSLGWQGYDEIGKGNDSPVMGDAFMPAADPASAATNKSYEGHGLLADGSLNPTLMRFASDMIEKGNPIGNQIVQASISNKMDLDNLNYQTNAARDRATQMMDRIQKRRANVGSFNAPNMAQPVQPQQTQYAVNPSENIPLSPSVSPAMPFSPAPNSTAQGQGLSPVIEPPIKPIGPMDTANFLPTTGYTMPSRKEQEKQILDAYNPEIAAAPKDVREALVKMRDSEIDMLYGKHDVNLKRRTDAINEDRANQGLEPLAMEEVLKLGTVTAGQFQQTPLTPEQMAIWGLNPNFKYAWDQSGKPVRVDTHDKATDTEAKGQADIATALSTLFQLEELSTDNEEIYGLYGEFNKLRKDGSITGNVLDSALNFFGNSVKPETVEALSKAMIANNAILAAVRGAAVGPEEQLMFERQLPVPGQPRDMYTHNLRATIENLEIVEAVKKRAKTGASLKSYNIPVGKMVDDAVYIGGDPNSQDSWYVKRYK